MPDPLLDLPLGFISRDHFLLDKGDASVLENATNTLFVLGLVGSNPGVPAVSPSCAPAVSNYEVFFLRFLVFAIADSYHRMVDGGLASLRVDNPLFVEHDVPKVGID